MMKLAVMWKIRGYRPTRADQLTDFGHPVSDGLGVAVPGCREGGRAAQVVTQFPTENTRVVGVSLHNVRDVVLEGIFDGFIGVEEVVRGVFGVESSNIGIHST